MRVAAAAAVVLLAGCSGQADADVTLSPGPSVSRQAADDWPGRGQVLTGDQVPRWVSGVLGQMRQVHARVMADGQVPAQVASAAAALSAAGVQVPATGSLIAARSTGGEGEPGWSVQEVGLAGVEFPGAVFDAAVVSPALPGQQWAVSMERGGEAVCVEFADSAVFSPTVHPGACPEAAKARGQYLVVALASAMDQLASPAASPG